MQLKKVSRHALERYAQRALGVAEADLTGYLTDNLGDIEYCVRDLFYLAEEVCSYRNTRDGNLYMMYVQEAWVLLLSMDGVLVTLFEKDLGVDDPTLNMSYVDAFVQKYVRMKDDRDDLAERIVASQQDISTRLEKIKADIAESSQYIMDLENERDDLTAKRSINADELIRADAELTDYVRAFVGKNCFD